MNREKLLEALRANAAKSKTSRSDSLRPRSRKIERGLAFLIPISIGVMILVAGCVPHAVQCRYFYLKPQPDLAAIAKASSYGECRCLVGEAITEYWLSRPNYIVLFAIGNRWYPELMLETRDNSGLPLAIRSLHVHESHQGGKPAPISVRGSIYRYFVREHDVADGVLVFQVIDASGQTVGSERIPLVLRSANKIDFNAL